MAAQNRKIVRCLGRSLDDLKSFPAAARQEAGHQIDLVQQGLPPDDWKPMPSVGGGVCEIRIRDEAGAFRVIYVAKIRSAVYILHCFQKKTQRTASLDIELARARFKALLGSRKELET
ncbi:MAG: type II toxin-antitoxin system RelE/ParE family toxin [Roseiarcus sp.]